MTAAERQVLKGRIDEVARARAAKFREKRCVGCGGEYRNMTAGCPQCWDRQKRRAQRVELAKQRHSEERFDRILSVMPAESTINRHAHAEGIVRMLERAK